MTKRRASTADSFSLTKRFNVDENTFDDGMEGIRSAIHNIDSDEFNSDEIVRQATVMLKILDESRTTLFTIRAKALEKQARFDKAIADLTSAIATCPTTGQSYLHAGRLYTAHGNPKLAIDILENGLRSSLPSDWPPLYDEREVAKRSLQVKVDFVSVMPPEVTAKIFMSLHDSKLKDKELLRCAMVSKNWRTSLLDCSKLWNTVDNQKSKSGAFQLLPSVSHHVQKFDIIGLRGRKNQVIVALAKRGMLSAVSNLSIRKFYRQKSQNRKLLTPAVETFWPESQLSLMSILAKQITELTLDATTNGHLEETLLLDVALDACENLKALTVWYDGPSIQYRTTQSSPKSAYKLEMLSIWTRLLDGSEVLQHLIPRCPRLRFLNITCSPPVISELILQHCLDLEELYINGTKDCLPVDWKIEQPWMGLRKLRYISHFDISGLRGLIPLLTRCKNTLEKLEFDLGKQDISSMEQLDWDTLVHNTYPRLKTLRFATHVRDIITCQIANQQVSRLLRSCPVLENVDLSLKEVLSDDFFTSFVEPLCLRQLTIDCIKDSNGGLLHLLEYLSSNTQKSVLKKITINHCWTLTDEILLALASVYSLVDIVINDAPTMVSSNGISMFLRRLISNPNLQRLGLQSMGNFTDDCMPALDELVDSYGVGETPKLQVNRQMGRNFQRYNVLLIGRKSTPKS